ncbi:MAG: DegT/DnrJ/EryC1/StrS family aminotransferase, partial [Deltaproteobacteria bacterium]|nr:DegT/DnrJ/EryC1/StrS family aminotransferase [Deltaproteobacteria bacterium]
KAPAVNDGMRHVFNQFVIRCVKRDELQKFLNDSGVGTAIYYPLPLHLQKCFSGLGYREGDFPESEKAARETLAIPVFPDITRAEQEEVVGRIADFYGKL